MLSCTSRVRVRDFRHAVSKVQVQVRYTSGIRAKIPAINVFTHNTTAQQHFDTGSSSKDTASSTKRDEETNATPRHALFMHGILGSKRNWRTPAKLLVKSVPALQAIVMDHRGHGESHGIPGENTIKSCASDVDGLLHSQGLTAQSLFILCGHSFGGKVALYYLKSLCEQRKIAASTEGGRSQNTSDSVFMQNRFALPQNTWVLDCLPGVFHPHSIVEETGEKASRSHSVGGVFDILSNAPATFPSVSQMQQLLIAKGVPMSTVQWLTSECRPVVSSGASALHAADKSQTGAKPVPIAGVATPESNRETTSSSLQLGFDLSVTSELFQDFCKTDMWEFLYNFDGRGMAANGKDAKIHFVRAGKNPLWNQQNGRILENFQKICSANPNINLHTMPHVGHWLQAEDARGLMDLIKQHST